MDEYGAAATAIAVHRVRRAQETLAKPERAAADAAASFDALLEWGALSALTPEALAPMDHAAVDRRVLAEVLDDVRITADMPEDIMIVVLNRRFQVTASTTGAGGCGHSATPPSPRDGCAST